MHAELQAVFDEHEQPIHASKRHVHDALAPIVRLAADCQKQVLEYRTKITAAGLALHDHALDGKLELMHQTFGAMEREATALSAAARNLAIAHTQLDRYVADWRRDIDVWEAAKDGGKVSAPDLC